MCGEYLLPPLSKVRAVCGSTACTDLRGGRRVIGVPTATTYQRRKGEAKGGGELLGVMGYHYRPRHVVMK
jgi:hypothetical protein